MISRYYGSVEAGGTKFVCAVGDEQGRVFDQIQFPTENVKKTLRKVIDYFLENPVSAIGVASFGPIQICQDASDYGFITRTPKHGWRQTNVVGTLKRYLHVPIYWTTDVNGAAFGEYVERRKQKPGLNSLVYYTIGTGVGAGCMINGKFLGGVGHPEMGHVLVKRHPDDVSFAGICPFHGDCLEGLVSGPTFKARLGISGENVLLNHPVWRIMSYYVAQAVVQTTLTIRPERIVFGGSVSNETFLNMVREELTQLLNGYVEIPPLEKYISSPIIPENGSATFGNLLLAKSII